MDEELINALVYTESNENFEADKIVCFPSDYPDQFQIQVYDKLKESLIAWGGTQPERISILSLISINSKGLVKTLRLEDKTHLTVILVFREFEDVIFYKYKEELAPLFEEFLDKVKNRKLDKKGIEEKLRNFKTNLAKRLKYLHDQEHKAIEKQERTEKEEITTEFRFKICLLGDVRVGKTSLVLRYTDRAFKRTYMPTIGANISEKALQIGNHYSSLLIWDIAGQDKFSRMRKNFYLGAQGIFLVFDLTSNETLENIEKWYNDIRNIIPSHKSLLGFVIGNKNDLIDERAVGEEEARAFAKKLDLGYFETSALTGENVQEAFQSIAKSLIEQAKKESKF